MTDKVHFTYKLVNRYLSSIDPHNGAVFPGSLFVSYNRLFNTLSCVDLSDEIPIFGSLVDLLVES